MLLEKRCIAFGTSLHRLWETAHSIGEEFASRWENPALPAEGTVSFKFYQAVLYCTIRATGRARCRDRHSPYKKFARGIHR